MRIKTGNVALLVGLSGLLALSGTGTAGAATDLTRSEAKKLSKIGVVKSADVPDEYFTPARTAGVSEDDDDARRRRGDLQQVSGRLASRLPDAQDRPDALLRAAGTGQVPRAQLLGGRRRAVAAAAAYHKALATAKGADCYRERLVNTISRNVDAVPKSVTVTTVPATVKGADEAWAYRVTFTIKVKDKEVVGNGHLVGSRVGQALLLVGFTGTGQEFTLAEATDYAAKPAGRVGAKLRGDNGEEPARATGRRARAGQARARARARGQAVAGPARACPARAGQTGARGQAGDADRAGRTRPVGRADPARGPGQALTPYRFGGGSCRATPPRPGAARLSPT